MELRHTLAFVPGFSLGPGACGPQPCWPVSHRTRVFPSVAVAVTGSGPQKQLWSSGAGFWGLAAATQAPPCEGPPCSGEGAWPWWSCYFQKSWGRQVSQGWGSVGTGLELPGQVPAPQACAVTERTQVL